MARIEVKCTKCGAVHSKYQMIEVSKNNRGGRVSYLCQRCNEEMHSYTTKNNEERGASTVHPFTYGIELETSYSNAKSRSELAEYHFMPTSDITVDVEYKSPIMNNLKSLSHLGKVLDKMIAEGDLEIGSNCGTHFHVGHENLNAETMDYIRRFYNSLFVPLCNEMLADREATKAFWGRDFGSYREPINMNTYHSDHSNFINVQHSRTLEFRISFYRNGKQYMNIAKFATKVTEIVMNNFVAHFNDSEWDTSRYANIREYRLHKAQVAAQKIVKAYRKAIEA